MIELNSPRPAARRRFRTGLAPVVATAALVAALVSGCSSSDDAGTTTAPPAQLPEGTQLVAESAKTTQTLKTVHLNLDVKNLPNLPVETVSADVTSETEGSGAAKGQAKVKLTPDAAFTDQEFLVVDKQLYSKKGAGYVGVGGAEKIYDPGIILDKDKGLANVIANVKNAKAESRETIDGVATVKVTGTIDAAVIDPIVPRVGEAGGTLPITLYIADVAPPTGTASTLPSAASSPGTGPNLVRAVIKKDDGTVTVTLSNWAKPVKIVKPGS